MAAERTNEWKLGLFVVTAVVAMFFALVWLGQNRSGREVIQAHTYVGESVQGLEVGSPVKFNGVTIGTVARIGVAPDRKHVSIGLSIYTDVLAALGLRRKEEQDRADVPFVPDGVRAQLASAGITGVKYVEILWLEAPPPLPELPFVVPQAYIPSMPSTLKSVEDTARKLMDDLPRMQAEVEGLLHDARRFLRDVDAPAVSRRTQDTLARIDTTLAELNVKDLSRRVGRLLSSGDETLHSAGHLIERADGTSQSLQKLLVDLQVTSSALRDALHDADIGRTTASVRDGVGTVAGASRDVGAISEEARAALVSVRQAADALAELSRSLERDPGSVIHGRTPEAPMRGGDR
jgi:ABC-type transporter Mla subunit MlaD